MYAPTATNGHDPWTSETSNSGQLTANFHIREFASRGTPVPTRYHANVRRLARNLQVLRDTVGRSIRINSGYRTPSHNASVGGATKSQHLVAKAGDMRIEGMSPAEVYCTIEKLIGEGKMQQGGLGVYRTFVHYDVRGRRARWEGTGVTRPSCGGGTSPASGGGSAPAGASRAVTQNRRWMRELGWQDHAGAIVRLLGFRDRTPGEQAFADAVARWQRTRGLTADGILGPATWRAMRSGLGVGRAPSTTAPRTSPRSQSVNPTVLRRIAQYDALINRVAAAEGVRPSWIRGMIAAESGGKANSGRGTSGYKGLMQAGRDEGQLDPATSIRTGAQKMRKFRQSILRTLRGHGVDPGTLGEEALIRLTIVAYNAGPGTVRRAMRYASAAGDVGRWFEPEHFQRALLYYGAYSVRTALGSCLRGPDGTRILSELAGLLGTSADEVRRRYDITRRAGRRRLWEQVKSRAYREKRRWKKQEALTMEEARRRAPRWLLCAIAFKHRNLRTWYVDRIVAYMRHFDRAD